MSRTGLKSLGLEFRPALEHREPDYVTEVRERGPPNMKFLVTDHNLRNPNITIDQQRELYREMKGHGISAIRFDWDWKEVAPKEGEKSAKSETRYVDSMKAMQEVGLEPPVLVISNPPEWASQLYKTDKEKFFKAYADYVNGIASNLSKNELKINSAQLFNEINHAFLFKFVDMEDLPRVAKIARDALSKIQPDVKLSTSIIVSNINDGLAKTKGLSGTLDFLDKYGEMLKENLDVMSVDYYPGVWHWPVKEAGYKLTAIYKQLGELKKVFEKLHELGMDYEIDEVGFPTNAPIRKEKKQRFFYDSFFRAFRQMLIELRAKKIRLPQWVAIYETMDEENIAFGGITEKILKIPGVAKATGIFSPENDFGLKDKDGQPKSILQGRLRRHASKNKPDPSQLSNIIKNVNRPWPKEK